ncbi:MAG TPA: glycosyltransferase, partial [Verrucomicrobiae bacterium]|nr:glycosyltransferase [Verrucomicrobiae bacterium]
VSQCITELIKSHQVVHIMGTGKKQTTLIDPNYHVYDFLGPEMPTIMKMAHMVICRAGLSTISELSVLGKVAIVVPMPQSHQELNAAILKERSAAVVLDDQEFSAENLVRVVNSLKFNVERQKLLARNIQNLIPRDASQKLANIIINLSNANSK